MISDIVTSVINGEVTISNWQTYIGAAVGGAAGGVVLAITGNMNAAKDGYLITIEYDVSNVITSINEELI